MTKLVSINIENIENTQNILNSHSNLKTQVFNDTCSICLESVGVHDTLTQCGHSFHQGCIKNIIDNKCPNCRKYLNVPSDFTNDLQKILKINNVIKDDQMISVKSIRHETYYCDVVLSNGMNLKILSS